MFRVNHSSVRRGSAQNCLSVGSHFVRCCLIVSVIVRIFAVYSVEGSSYTPASHAGRPDLSVDHVAPSHRLTLPWKPFTAKNIRACRSLLVTLVNGRTSIAAGRCPTFMVTAGPVRIALAPLFLKARDKRLDHIRVVSLYLCDVVSAQ